MLHLTIIKVAKSVSHRSATIESDINIIMQVHMHEISAIYACIIAMCM